MKFTRLALAIFVLVSSAAMAAPANESSVRQLLAVTEVRNVTDGVRSQFETLMDGMIQKSLNGRVPSPGEQQAIDNMKGKLTALVQETLAWETIEPTYIRLYQESFSEEEVAAMLSFYVTPAGKAVIHKMPILAQKSMLQMQAMRAELAPKLQKIRQEFVADWRATESKNLPNEGSEIP